MGRTRALSELLAAFEASRRRERERLALALHDSAGGRLTAAAIQLELVRMDSGVDVARVEECLEQAFDSVRGTSVALQPDAVERSGTPEAWSALVRSRRKDFEGQIECVVERGAVGTRGLYRIAEEALDNAVRHSGGRRIEINLDVSGRMSVCDDGKGFDWKRATREGTGLGLLLMRYLAKEEGRRVRIRSDAGRGTMINVFLPYAI